MKSRHLVSKNMHTLKIRTLDSDLLWRIVRKSFNKYIAYCVKDKVGNDPNCGIFGVFDGHGGRQVADHCSERMCDELRKEIVKNSGDLSAAIESVFLRVNFFLVSYLDR